MCECPHQSHSGNEDDPYKSSDLSGGVAASVSAPIRTRSIASFRVMVAPPSGDDVSLVHPHHCETPVWPKNPLNDGRVGVVSHILPVVLG